MNLLPPKGPEGLHHLAAAYALDALNDEERRSFEAHAPSCETCSHEVEEFRETAAILADAVSVAPRSELKSRVMSEVSRSRQLAPIVPSGVTSIAEQRTRRTGAVMMLAAAAVVVLVIGAAALVGRSGDSDGITDLLAAPDAVVSTLDGEAGSLKVVWSAERDQVAVVGDGLAPTVAGKTYALWFLQEGGVAPAGLFVPDESGTVRAVFDVAEAEAVGFGVSIEPDGGSEQPTGSVLYAAEF